MFSYQRLVFATQAFFNDLLTAIAQLFKTLQKYLHSLIAAEHAERVYAYAAANAFLHVAARNTSTPSELAEVRVRLATLAAYDYDTGQDIGAELSHRVPHPR